MAQERQTKRYWRGARSLCGATVLVSTLLSSTAVFAQIDEIIVTSQKREQSIQDVPISVFVVDGDFLSSRNFNEVSELQFVVPGFGLNDANNPNGQGFQVRGIGTQTFGIGTEDSVGVVVDGVVVGRTVGGLVDLSDIERVEILRGPQGTLFGKNASAGLLNIVTKGPTEEFAAEAGFSYSEKNEIKANAAVSGPLLGTDKAFFRLNGYVNKRDGLIDNIFDGRELNDRNEVGVRGKLEVRLSDSLTLNLAGDFIDRDIDCCAATAINVTPGVAAITAPVVAGFDNDQLNDNGNYFTDLEVWGTSAQLDWDVGDHTITSITAYRGYEVIQEQEIDLIPGTILSANLGDSQQDQITQELRVTSPTGNLIDYVTGLYFFRQNSKNVLEQRIGPSADLPAREVDTLNYAAFGEATVNVSEELRLIAGLRLVREELDLDFFRPTVPFRFGGATGVTTDPTLAASDGLTLVESDTDDTNLSWRFGVQYDVLEDAMVYFTASRGYKGGGFNTLGSVNVNAVVNPEIPTSYEGGLRSTWFDGRLTANLTGFYTKFRDFQAQSVDPATFQFTLQNAGTAETKGAEFEFAAQPVDTTSIFLSGAYVDATFKDFVGAQCFPGQTVAQGCIGGSQDLSGGRVGSSPKWTLTANLNQQIPLNDLPFDAFFTASYLFKSEFNFGNTQDPATVQDAYSLVDTSIGVTGNDGQYTLTFFVKNVFDENFATSLINLTAFGTPLAQFPNYNSERRFGFSVRAKY